MGKRETIRWRRGSLVRKNRIEVLKTLILVGVKVSRSASPKELKKESYSVFRRKRIGELTEGHGENGLNEEKVF